MLRIQHWQLNNTSTTIQNLTKHATKNDGQAKKKKEIEEPIGTHITGNWSIIVVVLHGLPVNLLIIMFMFLKMLIKGVRLSILFLTIKRSKLTWHVF